MLLFFAIFATNTSSQDTTNFLAEKPKITIINEDNDADFTKNFVDYVSKNAEIVDIPNEEEALADALFYGEINCYLKRLNTKYKITDSIHTHVLRHTFVTRCQENGIPLIVIQSLVGHVEGSTLTNDTYTHVSLEFMQDELNKIN